MIQFILLSLAFANLHLAPPNFVTTQQENIVFVDFKTAHYDWKFNSNSHDITSRIQFYQPTAGLPIVELSQNVISASVDGNIITTKEVSLPPSLNSSNPGYRARVLNVNLPAGMHEVTLKHRIVQEGPTWNNGVPTFLLNMWDIGRHRSMMEAFLPANFAYDQFKITMTLDFSQLHEPIEVFSNAALTNTNNIWNLDFKEHYNSHSVFLHFGPKANYQIQDFTVTSVDGRLFPMQLYMQRELATPEFILKAKQQALKDFAFVESKFGAFPHDKLVIYMTRERGGMEYAGATTTGIESLRHELVHSYYARSVMPANGNANWIDEAVATLTDENVTTSLNVPLGLASNNVYYRDTSRFSYQEGAQFLYRLHQIINARHPSNSIYDFLKTFFSVAHTSLITTQDFQASMEDYHGSSLQTDFDRFVYSPQTLTTLTKTSSNPHHRKLDRHEW